MFWDISIVYIHSAKAADTIRLVLGTGTRVPDSLPVTRVPGHYPGTRILTGSFYYPFAVHSTVHLWERIWCNLPCI